MRKYGMFLKNGKDIIHLTHQKTLESAVEYFSKLKRLPLLEFKKIFLVIEINERVKLKHK